MHTTAAEAANAPTPARTALDTIWAELRPILRPLASLQLTVVLFALAVGLVFFGTLAQKASGIWTVVDQYFWSWVVMVDAQHLLEFGKIFFGLAPDLTAPSWARFPFPGGKLLGGLMFANLLAAHALRFSLTWKRSGIFVLHAGLLLLFVGEFITREYQVEQQMLIPEGGAADYAIDSRNHELAFVTPAGPDADRVTVVPAARLRDALRTGRRIAHPDLPVEIEVLAYMPNSDLIPASDPRAKDNPATAGEGKTWFAIPLPEVSGVDTTNKTDFPSAVVRFHPIGGGEPVGTYLVSSLLTAPQRVGDAFGSFGVALRNTRYYKPFTIYLVDFKFDRYVGTDTPKNYSSDILLTDPEKGQVDRPVTIRMNEPFRHRGETFYQSSFTPDEKSTILQVVRNPGWVLPYVSCVMVTLGLLIHFGIGIVGFLLRSRGAVAARPPAAAPAAKTFRLQELLVPAAALTLAGAYVLAVATPGGAGGGMDFREAGRIPVVDGGRVKPLDTVARVNLRLISHTEQYKDANGVTRPAVRWFLEAAAGEPNAGSPAGDLKVFRVEHDQVRDLLKLPAREGLRYSVREMAPRFREFLTAVREAERVPPKDRDLYQAKVLELSNHIQLFLRVASGRDPLLLPPTEARGWATPAELGEGVVLRELARAHGAALPFTSLAQLRAQIETIPDPEQQERSIQQFDQMVQEGRARAADENPSLAAWNAVLSAYRLGDAAKFNAAVAEFRAVGEQSVGPADLARVRFEAFLNETGLFYHCTVMYILALIAGLATWVGLVVNPAVGHALRRATFWWLVATFAVHTFTLLSRMYLMDRPLVFVTNLYSSAVFIGWGVVGVCLVIERLYPIGVGNFVGAVLGFATSIIAHNLAASGDTLEMMQAVLDTNFWLATHVTTVTLGYSATYIAGVVGLVYIALAVLPQQAALKKTVTIGGAGARPVELGRVLGQIIYGVVCFATLLSFVGTVLGGIWADQSWGRFWGWDPKENGAILIVLWNALILHARWCGLVKDRGMAVLAVVGIMITTWSWFGTNQLGVGLHAYGFSNKLAFGCAVTWVLSLVAVGVGLVPWARVWGAAPAAPAKGKA